MLYNPMVPKFDPATPKFNIFVIVCYMLIGLFALVGLINSVFNLNIF